MISILVVDDDQATRKTLNILLGGNGYHVTLASSGEEALEFIKDTKGHKLLVGFRNISAVNLNNLADILVKASQMLVENPQILEMDLNPLIWQEGDDYPTIVDFRMTVNK